MVSLFFSAILVTNLWKKTKQNRVMFLGAEGHEAFALVSVTALQSESGRRI